jgi:hypothetical protein
MSTYREKINRQKEGGLYKVSDLQNGNGETREVTHEIAFLVEDVEKFDRTMDILHFTDTRKQLQVNVTNADLLMDMFGDDPAKWPSNLVTLYLAAYDKKDPSKLGIRVKKTKRRHAAPAGDRYPRHGRRNSILRMRHENRNSSVRDAERKRPMPNLQTEANCLQTKALQILCTL